MHFEVSFIRTQLHPASRNLKLLDPAVSWQTKIDERTSEEIKPQIEKLLAQMPVINLVTDCFKLSNKIKVLTWKGDEEHLTFDKFVSFCHKATKIVEKRFFDPSRDPDLEPVLKSKDKPALKARVALKSKDNLEQFARVRNMMRDHIRSGVKYQGRSETRDSQ